MSGNIYKTERLHELDGIRAFASMLVLIAHHYTTSGSEKGALYSFIMTATHKLSLGTTAVLLFIILVLELVRSLRQASLSRIAKIR
jgi:peptidoglycan/LPS O-acetylase OafA/YrhL